MRALALLQTGETLSAARWADRAATTPGAHYLIAMIAAEANGMAGRNQQAGRWLLEARRRKPDAPIVQILSGLPDPRRQSTGMDRIGIEAARLLNDRIHGPLKLEMDWMPISNIRRIT